MSLLLLLQGGQAALPDITGSGGASFPLGASGTGATAVAGSGGAVFGLAAAGAGAAQITGDGSIMLPISGTGAGDVRVAGDGNATVPVSCQGLENEPPPPPSYGLTLGIRPVRIIAPKPTIKVPPRLEGNGLIGLTITAGGAGTVGTSGQGDARIPLIASGRGTLGRDPIEELRILLAA